MPPGRALDIAAPLTGLLCQVYDVKQRATHKPTSCSLGSNFCFEKTRIKFITKFCCNWRIQLHQNIVVGEFKAIQTGMNTVWDMRLSFMRLIYHNSPPNLALASSTDLKIIQLHAFYSVVLQEMKTLQLVGQAAELTCSHLTISHPIEPQRTRVECPRFSLVDFGTSEMSLLRPDLICLSRAGQL